MAGEGNGNSGTRAAWKLSPSDFAFLWEQCKRCFYLKVAHGVRQPSMPMSAIFKRLEGLQKLFFDGRRTQDVLPELPAGTLRCEEKSVESAIAATEGGGGWFISGKLDSMIQFDDGSFAVVDFKTTKADPNKANVYSRQLNAYAYALENAAQATASPLTPISRLGLLVFEPDAVNEVAPGRHAYEGQVSWIEVSKSNEDFTSFIGAVTSLLSGSIPPPSPDCDWCRYAGTMSDGSFARRSAPSARPAQVPVTGNEPECPKCNAPMRMRTGSRGQFYGCSKFPECRGTRNLTSANT